MLLKLSRRVSSEERGFTLIELLVVVLIIGILAAIALPAFLGQQQKGQDASAKSDARNMVSQLDSCYANKQDYAQCTVSGNNIDGQPSGLNLGTQTGQVTFSAPNSTEYVITAFAKSGDTYLITKDANGTANRTCTPTSTGGCTGGNW